MVNLDVTGRARAGGAHVGLGHIQNYLLFGKPLDDTLCQLLSAGLYGFARLRMNTVWPLVFVHGLGDWL